MTASRARLLHLVVALVATGALVLQTVLSISGEAVLNDEVPPLLTRMGRLASYFTIQSNVLVAVTSWQLWRDPARDGSWWRVVRLAALVGITVTGLVHFVLLRPLLDLDGANWVADKLLHMVVPLLAVVGWALVGPRPRVAWATVARALAWPVVWLLWTLVVGGLSGWYPYPFLDSRKDGVGTVVVACIGITLLFLALFAAVRELDRRLAPAPSGGGHEQRRRAHEGSVA
ncbi:Pr6Pr family membrane protein [Oryzobacter terrae]|uniref:Pr6Pr family membrane protein n=1 Tax=Oryzobacter terrae TaxID=1620385 RepID=UPI003671898E